MKVGDLVWVDGDGVGLVTKLYHPYPNASRQFATVLFSHGEYDVCVDECGVISESR